MSCHTTSVFLLVLFLFLETYAYESCTTKNNARGLCQPLRTCSEITNHFQSHKNSRNIQLFSVELCGYENGDFMGCCTSDIPGDTTTMISSVASSPQCNDNEKCVSFKDCSKLFNMFRISRSEETKNFLKSKICAKRGRTTFVCCNDDELSAPGMTTTQEPETTVSAVSTEDPQIEFPSCEADGKQGKCKLFKECSNLYKLRTDKRQEIRKFLISRICRKIDRVVYVCCISDEPETTSRPGSGTTSQIIKTTTLAPFVNFPTFPNCGTGVSYDKIFGGNETGIGEFPWMALLHYKKPNQKDSFDCAGSLINERYVLTAAHCVSKFNPSWNLDSVRLGEWRLSTEIDTEIDDTDTEHSSSSKDYEISEKVPHQDYDPESPAQHHDIALLRLATRVQYSIYIKPICLPLSDELKNYDLHGNSFEVAGWGATETGSASDVLLKTVVKYFPFRACKKAYSNNDIILIDSQICMGGRVANDACQGDSGGPLMKSLETHWFLEGIVSFGPKYCGTNVPGVYTKVAKYMDWIDSNVRS